MGDDGLEHASREQAERMQHLSDRIVMAVWKEALNADQVAFMLDEETRLVERQLRALESEGIVERLPGSCPWWKLRGDAPVGIGDDYVLWFDPAELRAPPTRDPDCRWITMEEQVRRGRAEEQRARERHARRRGSGAGGAS